MLSRQNVRSIAESLLEGGLDPVPRYRLLRDVLRLPPGSPELTRAREEALASHWVREILARQQGDGGWGYFHSLASPAKGQPMTTEQAIRRLLALGLTASDPGVAGAVRYLRRALDGQITTPDREEKIHRWDIYMPLMLAAWLRCLSPEDEKALCIARQWARVIGHAFCGGGYDQGRYLDAFLEVFGVRPHPKAGRLLDFVHFYPLRLLVGMLPEQTERQMLSYVISHPPGIYYIYDGPVSEPPGDIASRQGACYLAALELLCEYPQARPMLAFAADWLTAHMDGEGRWDMGVEAKDGIHFPLSGSWRSAQDRKNDCTVRILSLLIRLMSRD